MSEDRYWRRGEPFVWLTGLGLAICVVLIVVLVGVIAVKGVTLFQQREVVEVTRTDGNRLLGEIVDREVIPSIDLPEDQRDEPRYRIQMKVGNRDVRGGEDFLWLPESEIESRREPLDAIKLERIEYGDFYGWLDSVKEGERVLASGNDAWDRLHGLLERTREGIEAIRAVEDQIGEINHSIEQLRLQERRAAFHGEDVGFDEIQSQIGALEQEYERLRVQLDERVGSNRLWSATFVTADTGPKEMVVADIVRAIRPNAFGVWDHTTNALEQAWVFVAAEPRESNTEGGVFPAVFGTVMMVILMSLFVVPFGVIAAIYLREYAREGWLVRSVRIAVNNLAGIPSIVYGVFGLGFFIYILGGTIDQLFYPELLPTPTWGTGGILWASLTLALLTVPVVIVSTEEALAAVSREMREGSLALGATKIQTVVRVLLPCATPGILTGAILAMARGAGEVAPLMITGVVKLAPSLPIDGNFPFLHLDRQFMHLGFHIYDVGFQSPNVEAAKPMVFATALLLLLIVVGLNLAAIVMRNRLRRRYATSGT